MFSSKDELINIKESIVTDTSNRFIPNILKPLIGDSFKVVGAEADAVNLELIEVEEDVIKGFDGISFIASF